MHINGLVVAKVSNGSDETHYIYDHFHRRISKRTNNNAPELFLHVGQREVGLYAPSTNELKEYRVLGLGKGAELGATIALELSGKIFCPLHDHRGNIVSLLDLAGNPQETYRYTAFGESETHSHNKPLHNPWGFASKRHDQETGFVYFSRRYYAPTTGRWITPDPLGFADGPNVYAYVHNSPLSKMDLYGLYMLDPSDESDIRRSAIFMGVAEGFVGGTIDLLNMALASSFRTDGFGGNLLGDHPYAMLNVYDKLNGSAQQLSDAVSTAVLKQLEKASDSNIPLRDCHTAGVYTSRAIGMFQSLRMSWRSVVALRSGVSKTTAPPFIKNSEPARLAQNNAHPMYKAVYHPKDPITEKPCSLPYNKHGEPIPSSDTPHTQIGWRISDKGGYIQTREWGNFGKLIKTTDWTDHRNPRRHPFNPHDHFAEDNPTGGTKKRGDGVPFKITDDTTIWKKN